MEKEVRSFEPGNYFESACNRFFRDPLTKHLRPDGTIAVLLQADDRNVLYEMLLAAASCGQTPDAPLRIAVCGREAFALKEWLGGVPERLKGLMELEFREDAPEEAPSYVLYAGEERAWDVPEGVPAVKLEPEAASDELLRMAQNLHYTYTATYGRKPLEAILADMDSSNYNRVGSLSQAAHIPVKLQVAGVEAEDLSVAACRYGEIIRDPGKRNLLVYLEHRRWTTFTILRGFRAPMREEIEAYAFRGKKPFRDDANGLHPALAECTLESVDALRNRPADFWDDYTPGTEDPRYEGLDGISKVSLWQHWYAHKRAEQNRSGVWTLLGQIPLTQEKVMLENAVHRLEERVNAEEELEKALGNIGSSDAVERLRQALIPAVEASRRRSYLTGDIFSVETLGFVLLFRKRFRNVIRSLGTYEQNVAALLRLDPERAAFLVWTDGESGPEIRSRMQALEIFLQHRKLRTKVHYFTVKGVDVDSTREALNRCREWLRGDEAVFDLTGAPPAMVIAASLDRKGAFLCADGKLLPFLDCQGIDSMNSVPRQLLVSDFCGAMGRHEIVGWTVTDFAGIEKYIRPAFEAYLRLTEDPAEDPYNALCEYLSRHVSSGWESGACTAKEERFERTGFDWAGAYLHNVQGCLYRLQSDGFVSGLSFDEEKGSCRCRTRCASLLESLFAKRDDEPTYSVKYDTHRVPKLRTVPGRFSTPDAPEPVRRALDAFAESGVFGRTGEEFRYATPGFKNVFQKSGVLLEDYVYFAVKMNPRFQDVRLSYSFGRGETDLLEHEIDVMAVSDRGRPFLISCKMGRQGADALAIGAADEIYRHAQVYSMNRPVPVLVTTCPDALLAEREFGPGGRNRVYVEEELGVVFLARRDLEWDALQQRLTELAERFR